MNNETLLNQLQTIKTKLCDIELANKLLTNLICDVRKDLLTTNLKTSDKERLKYCLNYCETIARRGRPILATTHYEGDTQFYTDAMFAVKLIGEDIMKDLPRHDKPYTFKAFEWNEERAKMVQYPELKGVFNFDNPKSFKIDLNKLYMFARVNKRSEMVFLNFDGEIVNLYAELLYTALIWANASKGEATIYYRGAMKPIAIEKSNGTQIAICPIRGDGRKVDEELTFDIRG